MPLTRGCNAPCGDSTLFGAMVAQVAAEHSADDAPLATQAAHEGARNDERAAKCVCAELPVTSRVKHLQTQSAATARL